MAHATRWTRIYSRLSAPQEPVRKRLTAHKQPCCCSHLRPIFVQPLTSDGNAETRWFRPDRRQLIQMAAMTYVLSKLPRPTFRARCRIGGRGPDLECGV